MPANTFAHEKAHLQSVQVPYVPLTVRVPEELAAQVKELAEFSGWQLSDYLRTLICVGAIFFLLSFGSQELEEAANKLTGGLKLLKLSRGFSLRFSERPYSFRSTGRKSTLTSLSIPNSVCDLIGIDANQVYYKCLQQGLLIYLKAQEQFYKFRASSEQLWCSGRDARDVLKRHFEPAISDYLCLSPRKAAMLSVRLAG